MAATSTYKSFLMKGAGTGSSITYTKLVDIRDYPDLQGEPETIDITTLSDGMFHNIPGIYSGERRAFTANYDKTDYQTIKALEGSVQKMAVWFGGTVGTDGTVTPTGADGKFTFDAMIDVRVLGGGVNEARTMEIGVSPTSDIVFSVGT